MSCDEQGDEHATFAAFLSADRRASWSKTNEASSVIFLCYRRVDTGEFTDRIREWLEDRLLADQVFMDIYSIAVGKEWRRAIEENLARSQVMLLIIGPHWIEADLTNTKNVSRIEIEFALARDIPIIPVLVQGTAMPAEKELPPNIAAITRIQAISVRLGRERAGDLAHLQHALEQHQVRFVQSARAASEQKQLRAELVRRVRGQIRDGKRSSLHDFPFIELDVYEQPDAIDPPWQRVKALHERAARTLPAGKTLWTPLDERESLLILGEPGAGKTTLLLHWGERLVEQVRRFETDQASLPVFLNLASWGAGRHTIREWIVARLQEDYLFTKSDSESLAAGKLILLLDGLDELPLAARSECIEALNAHVTGQRDNAPVLVCCRTREYAEQPARLRASRAIALQPLTPNKIAWFIEQGETQLVGLDDAVRDDTALGELVRSPLWLNLLAAVAQDGPPQGLASGATAGALSTALLDRYVALRLNRDLMARGNPPRHSGPWHTAPPYSELEAVQWLSWLGQTLANRNMVRLTVEALQPDMARRPDAVRLLYTVVLAVSSFLGFGMVAGLVFGLIFALYEGLGPGLTMGVIFGIIFGGAAASFLTLGFVLTAGHNTIKLNSHWRFTLGDLAVGVFVGPGVACGIGWFGGLTNGVFGGLLLGAITGLTFAVANGFKRSSRDDASYMAPGLGLRRTGQHGLAVALLFGLLFGAGFGLSIGLSAGLGAGPVFGGLFGVFVGIFAGLFAGYFAGLGEYCKHWLLRLMLARQGALPLRAVAFLRFATERGILRQIGSGFEFIHPLLRDYFAQRQDSLEAVMDLRSMG